MAENLPETFRQLEVREEEEETFNYGSLPTEMKIECIKRMDFMTRWRLRNSSYSDAKLVDLTPRCHVGHVHILPRNVIIASVENGVPTCAMNLGPTRAVIKTVLKMVKMKDFFLNCQVAEYDLIVETIPTDLEVDTVMLSNVKKDKAEMVKKIDKFHEISVFFDKENQVKIADLAEDVYEKILQARVIRLSYLHTIHTDEVIKIIRKWIETGTAIESIKLESENEFSVVQFGAKIRETFETRLVGRPTRNAFKCFILAGNGEETEIVVEMDRNSIKLMTAR